MFTKQHFILTAKVLKEAPIKNVDKEVLYHVFASEFKGLNPNFDADRFFSAIFPQTEASK